MTTEFTSEKQIQELIVQAIECHEFYDAIVDNAQIAGLSNRDSESQFPQFSIDHHVRSLAISAGAKVLRACQYVDLLTSDKNVSLTKGEVLRPDLVCVNDEEESLLLFELKKSGQTGRQSLTELLAYEQEIKNLLPMLSNYDSNFILISAEWTTLMDHAVSSAIAWSGRSILCLKPTLIDEKLVLETYIPNAWKVTGSVFFPSEALSCITLCLYAKDAYSPKRKEKSDTEREQLDPRIITALDVIAREGDRIGGSGFALLWQDRGGYGLTDYNITICGVSPFAFYKASRMREIIGPNDGWLVGKLDRYIQEYDPMGHSAALMATAKSANALLEEVSNPSLEGFSTWEVDRVELRSRAIPVMCEFWGPMGDYARSYVMHPAVRKHRRNTLVGGTSDWRDPRVGLPIIESFMHPQIFSAGNVQCSDAFRLGVLLGLDRVLRANIQAQDNPNFRCRFLWNRIELMTAIDEVRLLADAAENVAPPDPPLHFYDDPLVDDEEESLHAMRWLAEQFFQGSQTHLLFFDIGLNGCLVFDEQKRGFTSRAVPDEWFDQIDDSLRKATTLVLSLFRKLESEDGLWGDLPASFKLLRQALGRRKDFSMAKLKDIPIEKLVAAWEICMNASEHVLDGVFHKHSPIAHATIDWKWLKQGVSELRARGELDAGVILQSSGQFFTGPVSPSGVKLNLQIDNPDEQVPFLDCSHGFGLVRIVTWAELSSGEAFEND